MQQSFAKEITLDTVVRPESILVATDRTDMDLLTPFAVAQAKASNARLTLVSAITPGDNVPVDAASPYIDMVKVEREVRRELRDYSAAFEAQGVACDVFVECGTAVDVVTEALRRTGAQRLIMGTHGRGKLGRLTLGSVAGDLLSTVQIPVFAIGPHAYGLRIEVTPRRILHPVSLEGDYRRGVQFALELAKLNRAELTLMLVLNRNDSKDVNPERSLEWAENALRELEPAASASERPLQVKAVFGKVADEVCKMAECISADLIVIGVSGTIRFSPLAENTAYRVLARAECPVITAPHEVQIDPRLKEGSKAGNRELTGVKAESGY